MLEGTTEDWNFENADTQYLTHGFHPYPARMIPQVAKRLIERYSKPGELILDPFCGSGSVLVESRLLGRNSVGIDVNPLALILAKAKTTPIDPQILESYWVELKENIDTAIRKLRFREINVNLPKIRNLDYWFKPQVQKELTIIRQLLEKIENKKARNFFSTCFSITVRESSNLRQNEFKIYRISFDRLKRHNPDVSQIFSQHVEDNISKAAEFYKQVSKDIRSEVVFGDTRNLPLKDKSIDLVVTSPPYGDSKTTVAYGQFSRYSALWLGLNEYIVMKVDDISLGGSQTENESLPSKIFRRISGEIREKSVERSKDVFSYFTDLYQCLKQIHRVLKEGKNCCFVIGNRTVKRVKAPTDEIIAELGESLGLRHEATIYRRIPTKRMPWENAPENVIGEKGEMEDPREP